MKRRAARVLLPLAALVFTALLAACGREAAEGTAAGVSEPAVRDSVGVRIVENGKARPGGWRVGTEPLFTVGWDPGGPTFSWPQSGRILPDGGALVGDTRQGTIYRIGPGGSVMATWGRKGEGPGEYQRFDAILSRGDSILVSDTGLRRLTLLSAGGELRTTRDLALVGTFLHQISAVLSGGRLLLVSGDGYGALAETRPEWVFERQPILAVDAEAGTVDTLAELPHLRRWYGTRGGSPGPVRVKGRAGGFAGGFAWARSDEPEVRWYDDSGRLAQVARWDEEPVPLTAEWRSRIARVREEAYRSRGAEDAFVAAQLEELEQGLDRHEGPLPYWESFYVDRLGDVWLSQYMPGRHLDRWRVFTRNGTLVGWIDLPEVVAILDITDDRMLVVRHDELDVPAMEMLELIKP